MKMKAISFLATLSVLGSSALGRTWTSADGRTIEAEFIKRSGDAVIVDREGKRITIPLEKLAKKDRDWVASQAEKPAAGKDAEIDTAAISKILKATLKEEPSDEQRQQVVDFFTSVLPTKGAEGEAIEWDLSFPKWTGDDERTGVLLSANMNAKGDDKNRLMWFHLIYRAEEEKKRHASEKLGRYPVMRSTDHHCFVTVKRTEVRGVAYAESYKSDKQIDAIIEAIDLEAISKL